MFKQDKNEVKQLVAVGCCKMKRYVIYLIGIATLGLLLRLYFLEISLVPSSSMQPTLQSGDFILVIKLGYTSKALIPMCKAGNGYDSSWNQGDQKIRKGDVLVFESPNSTWFGLNALSSNGHRMVKRCANIPRELVVIGKANLPILTKAEQEHYSWVQKRNKEILFDPLLFPYDSTLKWTLDQYGPLLVPGKGVKLPLNTRTALYYKDVLRYECKETTLHGDSVFLNGVYSSSYTFKEDYYFMLGDNFYNSNDSRYWGFVPRKNIIGKAVLVLFSLDPDKPWYSKFRWNRFLKKIE